MQTVLRKLKEREQRSNAHYFIGIMNRLGSAKYRSAPNDAVTNTLAEYYDKNKTKSENIAAKRLAYNRALDTNAYAVDSDLNKILVGSPGAEFNDVELIGGMWRVQNKFGYKITCVRKKDFVITDKLPHTEHTNFEFYRAFSVCNNCYGRYIFSTPDYIVAKFETARGTYWAYGLTIDQARAYLGIKLCDEYQDIINAEICRERSK